MNNVARRSLALAAGLLCTSSAMATLDDPPYFKLWSGTGTSGETGDASQIQLCGAQACGPDDFAVFKVFTKQPAGSGFIDPFLRFSHTDPNGGLKDDTNFEAAYNSDHRYDRSPDTLQVAGDGGADFTNQAKDANDFNHAIMLGDAKQKDGYLHFFLDINEPVDDSKVTLRLDELKFFVSSSPTLSVYDPTLGTSTPTSPAATNVGTGGFDSAANGGATTTKVWDMDWDWASQHDADAGNDAGAGFGGLILDNKFGGSAGSGNFNLHVKLSAKLFAGFNDTDYIYLYNAAGVQGKNPSDPAQAEANFEEWSFLKSDGGGPPQGAPEPGALALMAFGMLALRRNFRQRRNRT
ncbi:MAG: hypothetical protein AB7Q97_21180 [Gammaproteobacteria bacterium]